MNIRDMKRLQGILNAANQLMDAGPAVAPVITNVDVIEATLADINAVMMNKDPKELLKLIELDS